MTRTLTGLYDSTKDAEVTVRDLEGAGISHNNISMVANNSGDRYRAKTVEGTDAVPGAEVGASLGVIIGGGAGLLAGLGMLAIPGVGPVVAAGWLIATVTGAVGGAAVLGAGGGLIGALIGNGVPEEHAHVYAEGVRRGGTLVSVRVDADHEPAAEAILKKHRSVDVVERGRSYRDGGWTRFDENASDYTSDELEQERRLRFPNAAE
jgi:hypothetical protein